MRLLSLAGLLLLAGCASHKPIIVPEPVPGMKPDMPCAQLEIVLLNPRQSKDKQGTLHYTGTYVKHECVR